MGCGQQKLSQKARATTTCSAKMEPKSYFHLDVDFLKCYETHLSLEHQQLEIYKAQMNDQESKYLFWSNWSSTIFRLIGQPSYQQWYDFQQELQENPFLQKNFGVYQYKNDYILVQECQRGLDLLEYIEKTKQKPLRIAKIFQSILQGLQALHQKKIIHGNLRVKNIIFKNNDQNQHPIIVHYGLFEDDLHYHQTNQIQPTLQELQCLSPEGLKGALGQENDIWSLGVILYRVVTGKYPFEGTTKDKLKANIIKGLPEYDSLLWETDYKEALQLVKNMLQYRAAKRWTAQDCLKQAWFNKSKKQLSERDKNDLRHQFGEKKIRHFKCNTRIEKATLRMLVKQTTTQTRHNEIMQMFRKLDLDNDGVLTKEELFAGFLQIMPEAQAEKLIDDIFRQADIDGQGEIDFFEFQTIVGRNRNMATSEEIGKIFDKADFDRSGFLQPQEIKNLFMNLNISDAEVKQMMKQYDADGDGQISRDEFIQTTLKLFDNQQMKSQNNNNLNLLEIKERGSPSPRSCDRRSLKSSTNHIDEVSPKKIGKNQSSNFSFSSFEHSRTLTKSQQLKTTENISKAERHQQNSARIQRIIEENE